MSHSKKFLLTVTVPFVFGAFISLIVACAPETASGSDSIAIVSHTLTFDANGGIGIMEKQTIDEGVKITLPSNKFIYTDYHFAGWATTSSGKVVYADEDEFTMGKTDATLFAIWTQKTYLLKFDANGGEGIIKDITLAEDAKIILPASPLSRYGYTFSGWAVTSDGTVEYLDKAEFIMDQTDATLYAVWTRITYSLSFDANGGAGTINSLSVAEGEQITLPANTLTRDGYAFAGWATTSSGNAEFADASEYTMEKTDATLYAVWTLPHSIAFSANGGFGTMDSIQVAEGTIITLPTNTFTNPGFTFAGWAASPTNGIPEFAENGEYTTGREDAILYAIWSLITYNLNFEANGGTGTMNAQSVAEGAIITLQANTFSRKDYTFAGWSTTDDGAIEYIDTGYYTMGQADDTLYAVWIPFEISTANDQVTIIKYTGSDTSVIVPNTIGGASVTSIGNGAFKDHSQLTTITLPDSLISINYGAFFGCTGLTTISLPNTLKSIGNLAFWNCSSLTHITLPNSLVSIGGGIFSACTGLRTVTLPDSLESIPSSMFEGCSSLISITLPDSLISIEYLAFSDCTSLTGITLPGSLTTIDSSAFEGCTGLKSISLPNSLTTLDDNAFSGCTDLTSISLPDSLITLGEGVFAGCTGLMAIDVSSGNTVYSSVEGVLMNSDKSKLLAYPMGKTDTTYTMLDTVTVIGVSAFYGSTALTSITLSNSLITIESDAFKYCTSLTSITMPDTLTVIINEVFYGCTSLTDVTLPTSLTYIGMSAFADCTSLTTVIIHAKIPPSLGSNVFSNNASNRKIKVPTASVNTYKSHTGSVDWIDGWSVYASAIEAIE